MTTSIILASLLYYLVAGVFCGVVFSEELGLPFTRENNRGMRRNLIKLGTSIGKHSLLWLPMVTVKVVTFLKD